MPLIRTFVANHYTVINVSFLIGMSITACNSKSTKLQKSYGRLAAEKELERDGCPHVLEDDTTSLKMGIVTLDGVTRVCCLGNPGEMIEALCGEGDPSSTIYESCSSNTYIDKYKHNLTSCFPQINHCSDDRDLAEGNSTTPSRCQCKEGYHEIPNRECKRHTKCTGNKRVKHEGTLFKDTVCETVKSAKTEGEVLLLEIIENMTANAKQNMPNCKYLRSNSDAEHVPRGSEAGLIIFAVIGTIAVEIIGILIFVAARFVWYYTQQKAT